MRFQTAFYVALLVTVLAQARTADAQPTRLVVVVVDAALGEPAVGVRTEAAGVSAMTDEQGRAGWQGLPPGRVAVAVRSALYAPLDTMLSIGAGETVVAGLALRPLSLGSVTVEAETRNEVRLRRQGFYDRRERRTGAFLTRADIDRRGAVALSQLFITIPGVRVDGGRVVSSRNPMCSPEVFLDGTLAGGLGGRVDMFPLADIAAIEVYRGPSEVPIQFRGRGGRDGCGAILIWTQIENRGD